MAIHSYLVRLVGVLLLVFFGVSYSEDLTSREKALQVIVDFADQLCKSPPLEGSASEQQLSGTGKAELNNVVRKVVDLGIEGAAKYTSSTYQGVLQKDLATALRDSSDCRREVFRGLKDKLLSGAGDTEPSTAPTADRPRRSEPFRYPQFGGYRLDWCLDAASLCGKPAADAWCREKGYAEAVDYTEDRDIGLSSPTKVYRNGGVCRESFCDGFERIVCGDR